MLESSCLVAFAALLHDLGKFAERARLACEREKLELWKQLDCPHRDGRPTHIHAAYTTAGFLAIEALLPKREILLAAPFAGPNEPDADDSLINAAARHHRPQTFLQWIIATADRLASGFERSEFEAYNRADEGTSTGKNHYQARLLSLFESIALDASGRPASADFCLPLAALSPAALFPRLRKDIEPAQDKPAQEEYAALWQQFLTGLAKIPASHRDNLPLWLDHFDAAWLAFTHSIPSATAGKTRPDVSLYDHSKAVAALAVALWRWHAETGKVGAEATAQLADPGRPDWNEQKLLLIQGDFFGIQDFIFANGGQTQKHAHRLLRGRSFQVSILADMAALRLLEALQLPSTSQIINAAGKFLIVAPNTDSARAAVAQCRREFDDWCRKHTFGESGVGLASTAASCNDLTEGRFKALIDTLFQELDLAKHRRFDLCGDTPAVLKTAFPYGPCEYHGRYPADCERAPGEDGKPASCALSRDQIAIGEHLTKRARLLVLRDAASFGKPLELDYFGYRIAFVADEEASGKYGELARDGTLLRAWDFDLPEADGAVFRGYARRYVNSFVPRQADGQLKTLEDIAAAGTGEIALVALKGDIDNLGALFQNGLKKPTFARWAALSRQVNAFFAIWLPWHCAQHAPDTYTVFAGGDDFFLIGPWAQTIELAGTMREEFRRYVACKNITFSLGAAMTHPNTPAQHLAEAAERGLEAAKRQPNKNAASLWDVTVDWDAWRELTGAKRENLASLVAGESAGFLYSLLLLADQSASRRPEDALWRSRLYYRCARLIKDKAQRQALISEVGDALNRHRSGYRIPVSLLLYRQRK
jgi:CRISPR-associated protein Csm1